MDVDPYKAGLIPTQQWKFVKTRDVQGRLVAVSGLFLSGTAAERWKLTLLPNRTRSVVKNEVIELILIDEEAKPGDSIKSRLLVAGWFEVEDSGQIIIGQSLLIGGKYVGEVVGFDLIHYPNHFNLLVKAKEWISEKLSIKPLESWPDHLMADLGISLETDVVVTQRRVNR